VWHDEIQVCAKGGVRGTTTKPSKPLAKSLFGGTYIVGHQGSGRETALCRRPNKIWDAGESAGCVINRCRCMPKNKYGG
jgi:hypothetical protein